MNNDTANIDKINMSKPRKNYVITLTFGEQAENHRGMQLLGDGLADSGFTLKELREAKKRFETRGFSCEYIRLDKQVRDDIDEKFDRAAVLIVRNGVDALLGDTLTNKLETEQYKLNWDKYALMYGRVVNKHARHNLCYGKHAQKPCYEQGKGRIISWDEIPLTKKLKKSLCTFMGKKAKNVQGEGNLYFDVEKCGIGFHGDTERKMVMAVRLGASMPLHFQWFQKGKPIGKRIKLEIHNGDFYVMSEKATGHDWKKKIITTLRHATGCKKFTTIKVKK